MVWDVQPTGLFRVAYRLIAKAPGVELESKIRDVFDHASLLDTHGEPIPWRCKPSWFTQVRATKS